MCTHASILPCMYSYHLCKSEDTVEAVYLALCRLHFHIEFSLLSWSPFKSAVCCAVTRKSGHWTKLMCISIGKPMHYRHLWLDNIILLSVFYKRSLHAPRYRIQEYHKDSFSQAEAHWEKWGELFDTKWCRPQISRHFKKFCRWLCCLATNVCVCVWEGGCQALTVTEFK